MAYEKVVYLGKCVKAIELAVDALTKLLKAGGVRPEEHYSTGRERIDSDVVLGGGVELVVSNTPPATPQPPEPTDSTSTTTSPAS